MKALMLTVSSGNISVFCIFCFGLSQKESYSEIQGKGSLHTIFCATGKRASFCLFCMNLDVLSDCISLENGINY